MPVKGSASAAMSATVRRLQPESVCQAGLGSYALQPLPAPAHAFSLRRVPFLFSSSVVPPNADHRGRGGGVLDAVAPGLPRPGGVWPVAPTAGSHHSSAGVRLVDDAAALPPVVARTSPAIAV